MLCAFAVPLCALGGAWGGSLSPTLFLCAVLGRGLRVVCCGVTLVARAAPIKLCEVVSVLCPGVAVPGGLRGAGTPRVKPPRTFPATSPLCPMHQDLRSPRLQAGGGRCPRPPQVKRPPLVSPCLQLDCPPRTGPPTTTMQSWGHQGGTGHPHPPRCPGMPRGFAPCGCSQGMQVGRGGPSSPEFHPLCTCQTPRGPRASRDQRTHGRGWPQPHTGQSPSWNRADRNQ